MENNSKSVITSGSLDMKLQLSYDSARNKKHGIKHKGTVYTRNNDRNGFISTTSTELAILLSKAASEGNPNEVKRLIANGASVHSFGPVGMNPLHLAAMNGHLEVCQCLKKLGVDINFSNKVGKTPLHLAAVNGHAEVALYLLQSGVSVDPCDMLHMTPLHWACDRGHLAIVQILLQYNADPHCLNKFGKSCVDLAKEKKFHAIIYLIEWYASGDGAEEDRMSVCSERTGDLADDSSENISVSEGNEHVSHCRLNASECLEQRILLEVHEAKCTTTPHFKEEIIVDEDPLSVGMMQQEEVEDEEPAEARDSDISIDCISDDDEDKIQDSILLSLTELEEAVKNDTHRPRNVNISEATELLRAQAALVSSQDLKMLLSRAVTYGHTIQFTEAGQLAFDMIKPDPLVFPSQGRRKECRSEDDDSMKKSDSEQTEAKRSRDHGSSTCCNALVLRNNPTGASPDESFFIQLRTKNQTSDERVSDSSQKNKTSSADNFLLDERMQQFIGVEPESVFQELQDNLDTLYDGHMESYEMASASMLEVPEPQSDRQRIRSTCSKTEPVDTGVKLKDTSNRVSVKKSRF